MEQMKVERRSPGERVDAVMTVGYSHIGSINVLLCYTVKGEVATELALTCDQAEELARRLSSAARQHRHALVVHFGV